MYDILIIGGGVIGASIARELSRYELSLALLEKRADLAMGTTKANSAIIHAGYDATPGTLKAKTNLAGNKMFDSLSKELDFPFKRIGSLVLGFDEDAIPKLEELKKRGIANGVTGLTILSREEALALEPHLGDGVVAALHAPTSGIVCPYEMTFALGENAVVNGAEIFLNQKVTAITKEDDIFLVKTQDQSYRARILINAAGVYADEIHHMISRESMEIIARAGEYIVFDRSVGDYAKHTIFQLPTDMGKGVLITPSVDGNLLIGPTAVDLEDKSDLSTTQTGREEILRSASRSLDEIPTRQIIHSFTGLRAHSVDDDFIIQPVADVKNMIDVAGIESPGLTAAPAIADMVVGLVDNLTPLTQKADFQAIRKGVPCFRDMDDSEKQEIIEKNPLYGHVVCRCETTTEGEIVDAIHRPVGARNLDAVKRRVRAGMGRCQGGFCSPLVVDILARELKIDPSEVTLFGDHSQILIGKNREIGGAENGE